MSGRQAGCFLAVVSVALVAIIAGGCNSQSSPDKAATPQPGGTVAPASGMNKSPASPTQAAAAERLSAALADPAKLELSDAPVAGEIVGQQFKPDKVVIKDGMLTFRAGKDFFADQEMVLFLFRAGDDIPANTKILRGSNTNPLNGPSIQVHVSRKVPGEPLPKTDTFMDGHAVRLEFGAKEGKMLKGKIHLLLPDERHSRLEGSFSAEIEKNPALPPDEDDVPYIVSDVRISGATKLEGALVGYNGIDAAGNLLSNSAGLPIEVGKSTFASSTTFAPRITTLAVDEKTGVHGYHTHLPRGRYLVYVRAEEAYIDCRLVEVKASAGQKVELSVDLSMTGSLEVTAPADFAGTVQLLPLDDAGQVAAWIAADSKVSSHLRLPTRIELSAGKAVLSNVRPGKYRVFSGAAEGEVEVKTDEQAKVELKVP